jgi:uncharacterized MAPEG superfamily protein
MYRRSGRDNMAKDASSMKIDQAALDRCKRADAAHQNGNESLLLFAPAVVAAVSAGVASDEVDRLSKLYLLLRYSPVSILHFRTRFDKSQTYL